VLQRGEQVRRPTDLRLGRLGGAGQHPGVEADTGHHREPGATTAADVDAPPLAVDRQFDGSGRVVRQAEVAGEQVAGTGRDDRQRRRRPGQAGDAGHHGTVATAREHGVHPGGHRLLRLPDSRVLRRRLQPQRLRVTDAGERREDLLAAGC